MRARGLFLIIFVSLLFSCVNNEFSTFDPNLEWTIRGKISFNSSEVSGIYNFAVLKKNKVKEIVVSSLFGIDIYRIKLLSNGVLVEDPRFDGLLRESKGLDSVLKENLEFISRWLPIWTVGQDKLGEPLPIVFREDGWTIELADFEGVRPRTIILNKRIIRAKIRILETENLI
jgi:hypothetical protein